MVARFQSTSISSGVKPAEKQCGKSIFRIRSLSLLSASSDDQPSFVEEDKSDSTCSTTDSAIDNLMDDLFETSLSKCQEKRVLSLSSNLRQKQAEATINISVERTNLNRDGNTIYQMRLEAGPAPKIKQQQLLVIDPPSVPIGAVMLYGVDTGPVNRRFAFTDSQHLFLFCRLLAKNGRYEENWCAFG